jgi:hypothetical protein
MSSTIVKEWKSAPSKDPPLSVIARDFEIGGVGASETIDEISSILQIDKNDVMKVDSLHSLIKRCIKCMKILSTASKSSKEVIYVKILLCECYTQLMKFDDAFKYLKEVGSSLAKSKNMPDYHIFRIFYNRDVGLTHYFIVNKLQQKICSDITAS